MKKDLSKESIKEHVAEIARETHRRGLCTVFGGGVSQRVGDKIYVTSTYYPLGEDSLTCFADAKPEDIIIVDMNGKKLEGKKNPSWETPVHIAIYKEQPEIFGIVHTHSPYATAFASTGLDLVCITDSPRSHLGKVPNVKLEPCGSDWLAANIAEGLRNCDCILLQNHGVWAKGITPRLALSHAELTEIEAKTQVMAALIRMSVQTEALTALRKEATFLEEIHREEKRIKDRQFGINYVYPKTE